MSATFLNATETRLVQNTGSLGHLQMAVDVICGRPRVGASAGSFAAMIMRPAVGVLVPLGRQTDMGCDSSPEVARVGASSTGAPPPWAAPGAAFDPMTGEVIR